MNRFTPFPDIYPKAGQNLSRSETEWRLDGPAIPLEVLVLSWASLLSSFTGEEYPVFALNGEPVKADLYTKSFQPSRLDSTAQEVEGYTAIVTDNLQNASSQAAQAPFPGKCTLSIKINLETGVGSMQSDVGIEPTSLDQIGRQLKQIMQRQAQSHGIQVQIPSTETPQLSIANPDPRILPGPQLLHQLALGRGQKSCHAIEFLCPDESVQSLSYEDLDRLSTALAAKIIQALGRSSQSNAKNIVVPVLIPQSVDLYIAWLAILKAGAAFCPLGTDSPEDRINFILKDVDAEVVVTQSAFRGKLATGKGIAVVLTDDLQAEDVLTVLNAGEVSSENLAYVMYTSGSTGRPKGVGISHRAVTQSLLAHDKLIPPFRRFLQFASPTFDVSVFEVFFPLFRGATLVGSERAAMLRDLPHIITKLQVDAAELTPTVAGELLRSRQAAPSLRVLLTIGEMLTRRVVDEFASSARAQGILHAMYGPTEAAIHCTAAPNFQVDSRVNLIGRPFETVSAFVVSLEENSDMQTSDPVILPVGQIGELVVGGPHLTNGYINRPTENSKAFLESPLYGRLYRTGDKARFLPNGNIECLGRISSGQVKLRGQRVELGEIENVVCMAQNVRNAVAVVVQGILVVWALVDGDGVTPAELRQFCQKQLPTYMVPGDFVLVHEFPRLASGKVDRKTMESDYVRNNRTVEFEVDRAYRDSLEEQISLCVSETLNTPAKNLKSLAAAGLDSLSGIQLAGRLRAIGVNLDVGKLLTADSVEGIWHLAKKSVEESLKKTVNLKLQDDWETVRKTGLEMLQSIGFDSEIENVEPCSHIQAAMLSESFQNPKAYCNWIELQFDQEIEVTLIKEAFRRIAQHNDILRSGFVNIGLPENAFCRFTWKTLNDDKLQETESFEYDWTLSSDGGILTPLRVQFRHENRSVRALIQMHHALYDGWSWDLFLDDLHSALLREDLVPRPSYANVVRYYMEFSLSDAAVQSISYWQDHLQDVVLSTWPSFHDRTDVSRGRGTADRVLDLSLPELDRVSRSLSVSRQSIFQAAFAYLLSSYLGAPDVVFGTVFSGRTLPVDGVESIIGPCLRVLPTRLNLSWVRTVADLILAIHNGNRRSLEYGDVSLREIKKVSGINLADSLFDSLIVWQETPWTAQKPGRVFKEIAAADFLEFSMTLQLEPKDNRIHANAIFEKSVFPIAQVQIFLEQVDMIVAQFIQSPDLPISRVNDRLPPSLLSIENPNFEQQSNLPRLAEGVEKIAVDDPNRIAIEFLHSLDPDSGDARVDSITYYELNCRANRLAHHLRSLGVVDGDLVAIILDKSLDLYISILAVIKIGAGYVPLTPQTPPDRIHFVLTEANPRLCIINSILRSSLHSLDTLHFVESDSINIERYPDTNVLSSHNCANLAYVVFTSGSTGKPKGVLITHHNLQSNIAVLMEIYPIGDEAKMLQACSQAFDVSVFEIFFTWHTGMTLCSATNDVMFRDIEQVIRTRKVTHLSLTPTVAALVHPRNVPGVRFLVTAGEGLTAKVHKDWAGNGLYQGYGPSETTNICTVRPNVELSDSIRNIGKPFKNTSAFVISDDKDFSLIPRGGVGEFCFGGDQVGRGYLNLPGLTSEKFINHPLYGRLYRSGDFGRLLVDGSLVFTGRRDDQVKLRGQRIELGEINSIVLQNTAVKDCTTMIVRDESCSQQQLITFWVPACPPQDEGDKANSSSVIKDLFDDLCAALPNYMVPSAFIPVDSIPMTTVKKIDNKKLEKLFRGMSLEELQRFSPSHGTSEEKREFSETEYAVAKIVSEVTQTPLQNIHTNTSLYNLGIDSISAVYLSKRLRQAGFGQLDVSVILRHGSVTQLATAVTKNDKQLQISSGTDAEKIFDEEFVEEIKSDFQDMGSPVESVIPCTALQEAMLSRKGSNDGSAYCNHLVFEVYGDIQILRQVWEHMVARHDILRTCFTTTSDARFAYAQVILKQVSLPWNYLETPADEMPLVVEKQKSRFIGQAQDLRAMPYSISVLEDKTSGKTMLLFSIHHALHDGEAMSLLLKEVEQSYAGKELPQAVQFHQFIRFMVSTDQEQSEIFWRQYLSGLSPRLLCPWTKTKGGSERQRHQRHTIDLDISLQLFETMCKEISVTPLNVFHAAWARVLALYTNSLDICFGNVFSCRTIPLDGVERIVGPCFNTLPIRIQMSSTDMNADIMKLAQRTNIEIMPHQLYSLRQIQKSISGDASPLFDTIVLLQPPPRELERELWRLVSEEGDMDFPIIIEVTPSHERNNITICLHSDSQHVSSSDAEKIARDFVALVGHTIRYPSAQATDPGILAGDIPSIAKAAKEVKTAPPGSCEINPSRDLVARASSREERQVRDVLSSLSGYKPGAIKPETTIFQLGLDSINAVQLSAILRNLGYDVPAAEILETPSLSEIASLLARSSSKVITESFDFQSFESRHRLSVCEKLGIPVEHVESIRPCTPVQSGMLALFTNTEGDLYFNRIVLRSQIPLNMDLLRDAWSKTVARHEMLRTGFVHLKDQQLPFAMITYRENSTTLPWNESKHGVSETEIHRRRKYVCENLHLPPWFLVIKDLGSTTEVEFAALHAIYDAQSLELILSDVAEAYRGNQLPRVVPNNLILGHILTTATSENPDLEKFWKGLESEYQIVKFPDLSPTRVEKVELLVTAKLSSKHPTLIDDKCRELGITLQAAGQAAWARLLSAYTGQNTITFGVVFSGRDLSQDAQEVVFPCLVTLPFQCCIQGTNRDLVSSIMKTNASLVKRQFTPLSKIQRWLNADQALFDTLFVYQKFSSERRDTQFWQITEEDARIDYPISIEMIPRHGELELRLTHRNDIVPRGQAMLILEQLDDLLMDCLFSPESQSSERSGIRSSLLSITPSKESSLPSSVELLHQFVEESAQKFPTRIAFEFASSITPKGIEKRTWTYHELNNAGNKVARLLQKLDAAPGDLIAICFDKCPEASFAILGILKAGCAFVALDPSAPMARKQFILQDSCSRILLCVSERRDELRTLSGVEVIALDEHGLLDDISSHPPALVRPIKPDDTCYCLYTSGTTGTPKGCEITHENAVQAMLAFSRLFDGHWDEESRWLQFASFHFDVSVLEQYWSWSVGICVTSCPRDLLFQDLAGTIRQLQITHIDLTPSLARLVHPDEVPSLCRGIFITGGEQLKQEILDVWGEYEVIYNGYGPTEVTIGCTMLPRMTAHSKPSNIGPQFDNVGSYVFKPGTSIPVLRGGMGELCVSGPLVGRGYLNRPELTKERFQFVDEFQERVYRTGDLVRILYDGSFQFLGRIDDQVKLRGQRLEIGEINAVIQSATSELGEVATTVVKHPGQAKEQLVSFVTKTPSKPRAPVKVVFDENNRKFLSAIKASCRAKLPGYMVPTHIIPISSFPLSPNNKADMKTLKTIYENMSLEELQSLDSLGTETQSVDQEDIKKVIEVLAEFSQTKPEKISPWSSIYELGLDSISVISFVRSLKSAGFQSAQVSLIMKNPTVAGIAMSLRNSRNWSSSSDRLYSESKQKVIAFTHRYSLIAAEQLGLPASRIEGIAPCTPLQEGMIFRFLESQKPIYCSSFNFELRSTTDLALLKKAWSQTQNEVQLLRAKFIPLPDGYAQVILKDDELPWFETTVSTDEDIEHIRHQSFNLWYENINGFSGKLWEIRIIKSAVRLIMCLNIFHALYDGNSLPLLLERVSLHYLGKEIPSNGPAFLDILPMGPLRRIPEAEEFWINHLAGSHGQRIFTSPDAEDSNPIVFKLDISDIDRLEEVKTSLQVTEHSIFHACWLLALHDHFSVVPTLGIVVSGRTLDIPGVEAVVGPLFNTIPSNIKFQHLRTSAELVQTCHNYYVSVLPFQHTALRDIMKWTGKTSENPLFEILFVFQKEDGTSRSVTEEVWTTLDSQADIEYPLALEVQRNSDKTLMITIAAKSKAISAEKAKELAFTFKDTLFELLHNQSKDLPSVHGDLESKSSDSHDVIPQKEIADNLNGDKRESKFIWTPEMYKIREVIAELAGVEADTIHEETSIFELGLDSIDAIRLSSRLSNSGISLLVSTIMHCRNIRRMAEKLSMAPKVEQERQTISLDQYEKVLIASLTKYGKLPKDAVRVLPTTPLQEAMIAEMVASNYQHYYGQDILELEPEVELERLLDAWKTVVNAHAILRTSFVEVEDPEIPITYAQIVHPPDVSDFTVIDQDGQPIEELLQYQQNSDGDINLNRLAFTLRVVRGGARRFIVLSIAHSLYDGWSLELLHRDVARCYSGETYSRETIDRPPYEPVLQQIIASSGDKAQEFWRASLANFTPRQFPRGTGAGGNESLVHRAEKTLTVPHEKIDQFCRHHGVTVQALAVTSWALVLAGFLKSLDVVFGLVLSGRNFVDAQEIMFPTMNTVAFRAILHGSRLDMLKYIQGTLADILEYQHFPLRKASVNTGARTLFDTLFIYQKRPTEIEALQKPLYHSVGGSSNTEYPISVEMELVGKSMVCRLAGRDDVLGFSDTVGLLDRINTAFRLIIEEPHHATIDFVDDGIVICESPAFQETTEVEEVDSDRLDPQDQNSWTHLEMQIRQVLSTVSGIPEEQIRKQSTLFHLGLDSISAIKVSSLLKKQSITLPVSAMLKAGTIQKMAAAVGVDQSRLRNEHANVELDHLLNGVDPGPLLMSHGIEEQQVEKVFPTTSGQTYLLAMNMLNPALFYPNFIYAADHLSKPQLDRTWSLLTSRVPVLRTIFIPTGQRELPFLQVVLKELENPIIWHESMNGRTFRTCSKRGITSGPVSLHASETERGIVIMLQIHHALYDAVSLPKLINILARSCMGQEPEIPKINLSDFVAFQGTHSSSAVRKQFWKSYLSQVDGKPTSSLGSTSCGMIQRSYRPGLVSDISRIEAIVRHHSLSIQALFLAIYARIHSRIIWKDLYNDRDDKAPPTNVVVGVYLANRAHALEGLPDLIAPTLNMVPLRVDISGGSSIIQSAQKVQSDLHEISTIEHSGVSLVEIADWTGIRLDVFVNFLRIPESEDPSQTNVNGDGFSFAPVEPEELDRDPESRPNGDHEEDEDAHRRHQKHGDNVLESESGIDFLSDVYRNSIDVEAAIRDNGLDVGIFSPEERLDKTTAESVLAEIQREMTRLVEDAEIAGFM
ncbi:hypothetical protein VTN77DRAFT_2477 [Rasamsonia byssochlamydoides]|uniref:uncharacterized protein n=1 Tax=Rasamsonia byssochlamydoides TaxID=89139 RepID=UPI0037422952